MRARHASSTVLAATHDATWLPRKVYNTYKRLRERTLNKQIAHIGLSEIPGVRCMLRLSIATVPKLITSSPFGCHWATHANMS